MSLYLPTRVVAEIINDKKAANRAETERKQREGCPVPRGDDDEPDEYAFEVYRQCDVWRFLKLVDDEGGALLSVFHEGGPIGGGWVIRYRHTEELKLTEVHT